MRIFLLAKINPWGTVMVVRRHVHDDKKFESSDAPN